METATEDTTTTVWHSILESPQMTQMNDSSEIHKEAPDKIIKFLA